MKINEVEAQVGITKKNIRFYEEQGLLTPSRNRTNGYRDYGDDEVKVLKCIKLLRKLGFPLEDIRQMQSGALTISDGMERQLITLGREQKNLEQSVALCRQLVQQEGSLSALDADILLGQMEEMERSGTTFQNKHSGDRRRTMVAPICITLFMVALLTGFALFCGWLMMVDAEFPVAFGILFCGGSFVACLGMVGVLLQRLREIRGGELEESKKY